VDPHYSLLIACFLFVGTHLLLSHPLRSSLVDRIGTTGFQIIYSLIAIATFLMVVQAYRGLPPGGLYWAAGHGLWGAASVLVLFASILFMGSLIGNPALPAPDAARAAQGSPRGVFAMTRHPMMWGFTLWAMAHALVVPTMGQWILSGTITFLALVGSAAQDVKKSRLMGDSWRHWMARTSFLPLGRQLSGRTPWGDAIPRAHALFGGIFLWLAASWAHGALGFVPAGVWRWFG
jgi:uncharacterized membrane protein